MMDAARIQYLAQFIPDHSEYFSYALTSYGQPVSAQQKQVDRFLIAYKDLAFGYHFIRALIQAELPLPPDVYEQELCDFYWFEREGAFSNLPLIEVLSLRHPSSKFLENSVQAMLLTDAPYADIAKISGFSESTIQTYEQLFFNVRDRRAESLFISQIVYPEHRLVETMEGYIREVDSGTFLKRSAYNNGLADVAYFIGLKVDDVSASFQTNAGEMAGRLEASIMANGYYLARNGFLNQRSAYGLTSAKSLLVAAKQGGEESGMSGDDFGATSIGDALVQELQKVKGEEMLKRIADQQQRTTKRPE